MQRAAVVILVAISGAVVVTQSRSPVPPASTSPNGQEVIYEGELETYIAVGGESTGWRLRRRNAQGRREFIEVLLTADVAQGVRANTRVRVRGVMRTRHYPERGEVQVLLATAVIEVARTR